MTDNATAAATIFGMAVVTYLTRMIGFYLSDRISALPPVFEQALKYLPGTIIVSIIAPQILDNGTPGFIAAIICAVAAVRLKSLIGVMLTGVITISILRNYIFI